MVNKYVSPSEISQEINYKDLKGSNVVFINMPLRESAVPNTTPQGPLLMATNLRDNYGVNSSVIDLNAYRIKDKESYRRNLPNGRHLTPNEAYGLISRHFSKYGEPDLVGFSGKITTLRWQERIAKMVRNLVPETFLVSGGGLATELKYGLFNYVPELDGVAHSEGDEVILKIVRDANTIKKKGLEYVLNSGQLNPYLISENKSGRPRVLYDGGRPSNLNELPFADLDFLKEDVDGNKLLEYYISNPVWGSTANNSSATSFTMERSTTFVSSRGCPYACSFCYRGAQGERNYGMRSPENLLAEFKLHIDKYGVDFIGMPDDNFAVSYERIKELNPILKPLNIRWGTHLRLDEAAGLRPDRKNNGEYIFENPKRIDLMADSGCIYIGFGAESASEKILNAMNKGGFILKNGLTEMKINGDQYKLPRTMVEGIKNCEDAGIHANCTWIMGYPSENLEDLKTSVAFIKWQEEFYASRGKPESAVNKKMFTATAYPGTAMFVDGKVRKELADKFGIKFDEKTFEPACDENFHNYLLELDDATKVLHDSQGNPIYFGDMPMDKFLEAREHVDSGNIYKILDMEP